jgi:hypothetical protein
LGEIQPAAWIDVLVLVSVVVGRSGVDPRLLLTLLLFSSSHFGTKSADGKRDYLERKPHFCISRGLGFPRVRVSRDSRSDRKTSPHTPLF